MVAQLDSELLLQVEKEARESNLKVGYQVKFPDNAGEFSGAIVGNSGNVTQIISAASYSAMSKETAEELIASEAKRLGINYEDFILLPFAAIFVE